MPLIFLVLTLIRFFDVDLPSKIRLPEFYQGESNVFSKEYKSGFLNFKDEKGRFTPDVTQIRSAEIVFVNQYDSLWGIDPKGAGRKSTRIRFKKWRRNYIGYIDQNGDKIVLMQLVNFRNNKDGLRHYSSWGKEFEIGLGGWYESNQSPLILVNITRSNLSIY